MHHQEAGRLAVAIGFSYYRELRESEHYWVVHCVRMEAFCKLQSTVGSGT